MELKEKVMADLYDQYAQDVATQHTPKAKTEPDAKATKHTKKKSEADDE